eukprot:jgi/Mesvir1/5110/Mv15269-RA.1
MAISASQATAAVAVATAGLKAASSVSGTATKSVNSVVPTPRRSACFSSSFAGQRVALTAGVSLSTPSHRQFEVQAMATAVKAVPRAPKLAAKDAVSLIDSVKTFIFDCDGVIWRGDILIEGVADTLDMLRAKGKKLIFVTNNSTKSRRQYLKKFESLGLTVGEDEIFSSSFAAAAYLKGINFQKKVYVIGEVGIQKELDLAGIRHLGGPEDGKKEITLGVGTMMEHDHDVGAVVVGFDRYINYYKLQYATLCIRENPGCMFIATNCDAVTHLTDAQEWAGGGSMVGAIMGSTGRKPHVVGKPSNFMLDWMTDNFGIAKNEICMVGDRLDTDILFGQDGGTKTMLVLSGMRDHWFIRHRVRLGETLMLVGDVPHLTLQSLPFSWPSPFRCDSLPILLLRAGRALPRMHACSCCHIRGPA